MNLHYELLKNIIHVSGMSHLPNYQICILCKILLDVTTHQGFFLEYLMRLFPIEKREDRKRIQSTLKICREKLCF